MLRILARLIRIFTLGSLPVDLTCADVAAAIRCRRIRRLDLAERCNAACLTSATAGAADSRNARFNSLRTTRGLPPARTRRAAAMTSLFPVTFSSTGIDAAHLYQFDRDKECLRL